MTKNLIFHLRKNPKRNKPIIFFSDILREWKRIDNKCINNIDNLSIIYYTVIKELHKNVLKIPHTINKIKFIHITNNMDFDGYSAIYSHHGHEIFMTSDSDIVMLKILLSS